MNEQPWWTRTPILVAVAVAVIAVLAGVLVFTGGSDGSGKGSDNEPSSGSTDPAKSSSWCKLPDGRDGAPTSAPKNTKWVIAPDGTSAPVTADYGPGSTADGFRTCFARNPVGAVVSAMWYVVESNLPDLDRNAFALARLADESDRAVFAEGAPPTSDSQPAIEFRGFRFNGPTTRSEASVELLVWVPSVSELRSMSLDLTWAENDWLVRLPSGDPEVSRQSSDQGFIPWMPPEAEASPAVSRAAPGWGVRQPDDEEPVADPPYTAGEQQWADNYQLAKGKAKFAAMSHDERQTLMTPDPPLTSAERKWLASEKAADQLRDTQPLHSDSKERFFGYSHKERGNVMKGMYPDGEVHGGGAEADGNKESCSQLSVKGCFGVATGVAKDKAEDAAGALANSAFGKIANYAVEAAEWSMKTLMTAWLKYPSAAGDVSTCYGGDTSCNDDSVVAWAQGHLHWIVVFAMIGSIMIASIRMALTANGEHARELGSSLLRMVLVAFGAGPFIVLGLEVGDLYSEWILSEVSIDLNGTLLGGGVLFAGITNPFMLLILAGLMVFVQIVQFGLMVIRSGMVVVLASFLPLAATNRSWLTKSSAWLVAWLLYKPVAATLYAIAIKMTNGDQGPGTQFSGILLMIGVILALPAMLRFATPLVSAAVNGNAAAGAAAVVGGTIATGAMLATGGASAAATGGGFAGFTTAGGRAGGAAAGGGGGGPDITSPPTGSSDPGGPAGAQPPGRPDVVQSAGDTTGGGDPGSPAGGAQDASSSPAGQQSGADAAPAGVGAMSPAAAGTTSSGSTGAPGGHGGASITAPPPVPASPRAAQGAISAGRSIVEQGIKGTESASGAVESERQS